MHKGELCKAERGMVRGELSYGDQAPEGEDLRPKNINTRMVWDIMQNLQKIS